MNTDQIKSEIKSSKYICVFGIGAISYPIITAIQYFTDIKIDFLCDNDSKKWGNFYHNYKCISPSTLAHFKDEVSVIIATRHYKEINKQLNEMGINKTFVLTEYRLFNDLYFRNNENLEAIKTNIPILIKMLADEQSKDVVYTIVQNWFDFDIKYAGYEDIFTDDQYYPEGIIKLTDKESFVDVGAYNGDTVLEFIKRTDGKFNAIHAFELDESNYDTMEKRINEVKHLADISLYNIGLSDREEEVFYETGASGSQSSFINKTGSSGNCAKVARLDDVVKEQVTFIKMDIEGSELLALSGAEETIRKHKPKLAICVYHKPNHLWEVPFYIKKINPKYKIYFRHHSPLEYETVCYAI